jgi:hypothetical protein
LKLYEGLRDYRAKVLEAYLTALPEVMRELGCPLVVRPHPSENHEMWKEWAKNQPNVIVESKGGANSWMMAADAVLHSGCTTGMEGFLLERPMIAFTPFPESKFSDDITNTVSVCVKYCIENVDGPFAVDRIVDALLAMETPRIDLKTLILHNKKRSRQSLREARKIAIISAVKGVPHKMWGGSANTSRGEQKFAGLESVDLECMLDDWHERGLLEVRPQVLKIDQNLFCVFCEGKPTGH